MKDQHYKWYILTLTVLTSMIVVAIPQMGVSVLAKEISDSLGLSLVQVGVIWGVGALPGILTSLLGGMIGDKIGPKRVLAVGAFLGGLLGLARGFAQDFATLAVLTVLLGAVLPMVLMNSIKVLGLWFPPHQLGMANGMQAMSMAMGFMLGSLFSATTLSPLLGGWRNVLIVYGVAGALLGIPWLFTRISPRERESAGRSFSVLQSLRHVAGLKNIWLLGFALFGISGAIQGTLGYLPLYLRNLGWEPLQADGVLTAFHTASMIFVLPVSFWSDRLGSRKRLLLVASLMIASGFALLSFVRGGIIWAAVMLSGSVRDAFMAMFMTKVIETDGVGPVYAGTATGFAIAIANIGNLLAPPLGNSLAAWLPSAPFAFWSGLSFLGFLCLLGIAEKRRERQKAGLA